MIAFTYLQKYEFERYSETLFGILADNMSEIAPTGNAREEDYKTWHRALGEILKKDSRQIILISDSDTGGIIGYFQYDANDDTFLMEEIQFMKEYRGKRVFRQLYRYVLPQLHGGIRFVTALASKRNHKSNGILARLGLSIVGENKSGTSWRYRGDYDSLLTWLDQR